MEAEDLPHSLHPGFEPEQEQERPKRSYSSVLGILWLLGMLSLAAAFGVVSRYFDASERLNSLVLQKKHCHSGNGLCRRSIVRLFILN